MSGTSYSLQYTGAQIDGLLQKINNFDANDYFTQEETDDEIWELVDDILGNPSSIPDLFVGQKNNNYALKYQDINDVVHEIFDFANLPFTGREHGHIASNNIGWYTNDSNYTMTGTYDVVGNFCILQATVRLKSGWESIKYSLPITATQSEQATIYFNGVQYTLSVPTSIDNSDNYSVLDIRKFNGTAFSADDLIKFTFTYRIN